MLKNVSHTGGVEAAEEILFDTPFGYMFRDTAESPECVLPVSARTQKALIDLGDAMGDASAPPDPSLDCGIPAGFTYLGQFIDHDITARTDRDTNVSRIPTRGGKALPVRPLDPEDVVEGLRNGRRPQLDLDSLYGDGPGLIQGVKTEAIELYEPGTGKLRLQDLGTGLIDVPREGRTALIGDARNDENVNVSQLHAAFIALHNTLVDKMGGSTPPARKYSKARQIVRWVYQYIVAHDYLPRICDADIVNDVVRNGPFFFGPGVSGSELFMPLEFSVAGFRFGHSMVRPSYSLQGGTPKDIVDILGVSTERHGPADLLEEVNGQWRLKPDNLVHWSNFLEFAGHSDPQKARKIDPLISRGLFELPFEEGANGPSVMRHLAQRNLLRGYLLSIPTGQAVAAAMGIVPLIDDDMTHDEDQAIKDAIEHGDFQRRTPLWYYVLKEAKTQKGGESLGTVGSRLVAETLIGFLKHDPNSFMNNGSHSRITHRGIKVPARPQPIRSLADMVDYVGLKK